MPPSMKLPYRRATDPLTAINVGRTLLEASARGKDYPVTAVQKFAAVLAISGRRLDDVPYDYYHNTDALKAAEGSGAAGRADAAADRGDDGGVEEGEEEDDTDSIDEEARQPHHAAANRLQALLAQTPPAQSAVQGFFAELLDLDDSRLRTEGSGSSTGSRDCSAPSIMDVPGPDVQLAVDAATGTHTLVAQKRLRDAMRDYNSFVVRRVAEAGLRALLLVLGTQNSEGGGWCIALGELAGGAGTLVPPPPADDGAAAAAPLLSLRVIETPAVRRSGDRADTTLQAPPANLSIVFEAPLLRDLTNRASSVSVFPAPPAAAGAGAAPAPAALLPLLCAVASVGRKLRAGSSQGAESDLVLIPHVAWGYDDAELVADNATVWFVVAKCEKGRPDHLAALDYELPRGARARTELLVPRPRPPFV